MSKIRTNINTARRLVQQYELDTEVYIVDGMEYGSYNVIRDCIFLNEYYNSYEEFLITLLHEICHALDNKRLGKKYLKKYNQASQVATHYGLNAHDHNKWEIKAENWATKEKTKWIHY